MQKMYLVKMHSRKHRVENKKLKVKRTQSLYGYSIN